VYDLDFKTPNNDGKQKKTGADLMARYKELCAAYPIVSIEDPFDREDWENTKSFNAADVCQVRDEFRHSRKGFRRKENDQRESKSFNAADVCQVHCESEIDGFRHSRKRFRWKEEG
jgi:hypothetical protein